MREALAAKRYDFRMGSKLRPTLEAGGLEIAAEFTVADKELAFDGPAHPDVIEGWSKRLDRMQLLRRHCGPEFDGVHDDFLACLRSPDHRSLAQVTCCIATKGRAEP